MTTMTASEQRAAELRALIGEPATIARELDAFRTAAKKLSSDQPRFIEEYPQKWVAVCDTTKVVAADSLDDLLKQLDSEGISREHVIVRFIDRAERTLFL
jgi:hypothetical protein